MNQGRVITCHDVVEDNRRGWGRVKMELIGKYHGQFFVKEAGKTRLVKQNTLDAFKDIQSSGVAKSQRLRILYTIRRYTGISRQSLSKELDISINATCGRVNSLLKTKSIYESGDEIGESGFKNALLKAYEVKEIEEGGV